MVLKSLTEQGEPGSNSGLTTYMSIIISEIEYLLLPFSSCDMPEIIIMFSDTRQSMFVKQYSPAMDLFHGVDKVYILRQTY